MHPSPPSYADETLCNVQHTVVSSVLLSVICHFKELPYYSYVKPFPILIASKLRQMSVQSSFDLKLAKSFLVNSCNLELGETIGQGTCIIMCSYIAVSW